MQLVPGLPGQDKRALQILTCCRKRSSEYELCLGHFFSSSVGLLQHYKGTLSQRQSISGFVSCQMSQSEPNQRISGIRVLGIQ